MLSLYTIQYTSVFFALKYKFFTDRKKNEKRGLEVSAEEDELVRIIVQILKYLYLNSAKQKIWSKALRS